MEVAIAAICVIVFLAIFFSSQTSTTPAPQPKPEPEPTPAPTPVVDERLLRWVDKPCVYGLGKGGRNPSAASPMVEGKTDCTGFGAWYHGIDRHLGDHPDFAGDWFETTMIYNTARKAGMCGRAITEGEARVGDGVVIPDANGGQGHYMVVAEVAGGKVTQIVDCSASNPKGKAIQKRPIPKHVRARKDLTFVRWDLEALRGTKKSVA